MGDARDVLGWARLEVERPDAIGARFEQVVEQADLTNVALALVRAESLAQDEPLPPGVRPGVGDAAGDLHAVERREDLVAQRKFREEQRYPIGPRQVTAPVHERDGIAGRVGRPATTGSVTPGGQTHT